MLTVSRKNFVVVLSSALALCMPLGSASAQAPAGVVRVTAFEGDRAVATAGGFAVAPELVATAFHAVEDRDRIAVDDATSGETLAARVVYRDERAALALVRVEALGATPMTFAREPVERGQAVVTLLDAQGGVVVGSIGALNDLEGSGSNRRLRLFEHNAMVPSAGYGMPVLNECGEIIGINRFDPDFGRAAIARNEAPSGRVFALDGADVQALLAAQGVATVTAAEDCLTAEERAARAEQSAAAEAQRADAAQERAAELETEVRSQAEQAELAQTEADQARQLAEAAALRAEELAAQAQALANTVVATETEKQEAAARAEEARQAALAAEAAVTRATAEAQKQQAALMRLQEQLDLAQKEARITMRRTVAVVAIAAVLVVIAWWIFAARKRRHVQALQTRAASAERAAAEAERLAASAVQPAPFSAVLQGRDRKGGAFLLKIPAEALGNPEGVVIGRNPRNASFLIDHDEISREHARLTVVNNQLLIADMGTTNGTKVDGRPVTGGPAIVRNGAIVELGPLVLEVRTL